MNSSRNLQLNLLCYYVSPRSIHFVKLILHSESFSFSVLWFSLFDLRGRDTQRTLRKPTVVADEHVGPLWDGSEL